MFVHLLVGSLVFLFFGKIFGFEISRAYLVIGAFFGFLPDLFSYVLTGAVKLNKWAHTHRDNFSHSIFLPVVELLNWLQKLLCSLIADLEWMPLFYFLIF